MKNTFQFLFFLITIAFASNSTAQSQLTQGDLAFVAYGTTNPDRFAFVNLVDLQPNTVVYFTDNGWSVGDTFFNNENTMRWISPSNLLPAGNVVWLADSASNPNAATNIGSTIGKLDQLSSTGEQVFAYQKNGANVITLIAAISSNNWLTTCNTTGVGNTTASCLPQALTNGLTALGFTNNSPNRYYNQSVITGTRTNLLQNIYNPNNWNASSTIQTWPQLATYTINSTTNNQVILQTPVLAFEGDTINFSPSLTLNGTIADSVKIKVTRSANCIYNLDYITQPAALDSVTLSVSSNALKLNPLKVILLNDTIQNEPNDTVFFTIQTFYGNLTSSGINSSYIVIQDRTSAIATAALFTFSGAIGNEPVFPPDFQPNFGSVTDFSRGSGIGNTTGANAFVGTRWNVTAIDPTKYFEFSFTPNANLAFLPDSFKLELRSSNSGPVYWELRTQESNFNLPVYADSMRNLGNNESFAFKLPLSYRPNLPITFRLYAAGATGATGSWKVDNLRLTGTSIDLTDSSLFQFKTDTLVVYENEGNQPIVLNFTKTTKKTGTLGFTVANFLATTGIDYNLYPSPINDTLSLNFLTGIDSLVLDFLPYNRTGFQGSRYVNIMVFEANMGVYAIRPDTLVIEIRDSLGTNVNNLNTLNWNIYPNPAHDELFVQTHDFMPYNLKILNTLGQLVMDVNQTALKSIPIQALQPGIYFITINTLEGALKTKFIKY